MKTLNILALAGILLSSPAFGQAVHCRDTHGRFAVCAPGTRAFARAPGATAQCRDNSLSYSAHHSGTCSRHGGVATWYR